MSIFGDTLIDEGDIAITQNPHISKCGELTFKPITEI
jgi:hypothetical protein